MQKITPKALIIIGCIVITLIAVAAVFYTQTNPNTSNNNSVSGKPTLSLSTTKPSTLPTPVPVGVTSSGSMIQGPLVVSIGDYNAKLPVVVDTTNVGNVSNGKPLNISVNEGYHIVKVCSGKICEEVGVEVKSAIKIMVDFGERLKKGAPQRPLSISIGNYNAKMQVYIDDILSGEVSPNKLLNINVTEGLHNVRVCSGNMCKQQDIEIKSTQQNTVDFWELLTKDVPKGPLTVSIGGYNAEVPVYIDNTSVGMVSMVKPLNIMVSEGLHTVKVCVGAFCENESVEIKFAQPVFVDFGDRLKSKVQFSTPTVRILSSVLNVNRVTINLEFINPDKIDRTMSATIGCGYSYIDSNSRNRKNDFAQTIVTRSIKAGARTTTSVDLSLSRGSSVIASEPSVVEVIIT